MSKTSTLLRLIPLAGMLLLTHGSFAQDHFHCATDEVRAKAIQADPELLHREAAMEEFIQNWIAEHRGDRQDDSTVFTIPVVFHILHMNGPENISDLQVHDAMEVLNRDYRKLNADLSEVCCGFDTITADILLHFELATIDPEGNCTDGIDRVRTIETFQGDNGSKVFAWPRDKYLNVWSASRMGGGAAGYSQYPSNVEGLNAPADGVMILSDYLGRNCEGCTGNENQSRALTHEVGHWLDLKHVWGDNNGEDGAPAGHMSPICGDDGVADTPWTRGWNVCPQPEQSKNCDPNIYENYQNYMEYSYCSVMFTRDQRDRMRAALASPTADRNNLSTAENLAATGTDGINARTCGPKADFYSAVMGTSAAGTPRTTRLVCLGDAVPFHDNSSNHPTSWNWSFQDGDPANSSEQNPTVTFNVSGWKTVTLTVANDHGTDSHTDQFSIYIANSGSDFSGLYYDSFEDGNMTYLYPTENYDGNLSQWNRVCNAAHSGSCSFRLNGRDTFGPNDYPIDDGGADIDALITPTFDLSNLNNPHFTFWWAYTTRSTNEAEITERLEIWSSNNCGRTWQIRTTIEGLDLVTGGAQESPYIANDPSDWRFMDVDLPGSLETDHVRMKFIYYSSAASNNLFVDDLNITGAVGIDELSKLRPSLSVSPNPTDGLIALSYSLPVAGNQQLRIEDAQGRLVRTLALNGSGDNRVDVDLRGVSSGMYFARIVGDVPSHPVRFAVR